MALKIDIGANTRAAASQIKDLGSDLETVVDALDEVGRQSKGAGDKLERALQDAEDQAKRTARQVDKVGDDGFKKAGAASGEFKQEALSNFSEVTSSFDGSMSSVQDLAQGTLGGLASSGLPGVGIAAGIAATGIGLIGSALQQAEEKRAALQQRASDLAQAYIEAGTNVLDAMGVAAATQDIVTDEEKRKDVKAYADALGIDFATAARAYVGDANAMAVVDAQAAEARQSSLDIADKQRESLEALTPVQMEQIKRNSDAMQAQRELNGVVTEANNKFNDQQAVLAGLINDAEGATAEVDELGNTLYSLPDGTQIMVSAETGKATTDVSTFKGDIDGIPEVVTTRVDLVANDKVTAVLNGLMNTRRTVNVDVNYRGAGGTTWY